MGPQDQKWRSMYYETASMPQERPKIDNMKNRFEEHFSHSDNFQSAAFGGNDQHREIKRQNDFLKHYSKKIIKLKRFLHIDL